MAASDRGDELVQLRRQLVAVQAELQAFTYSVSHDLRAPLRHINAYAQIIAEDWPGMPTDAASHLATIRQSAQLLAAQLDGLTQLSRQSVKPISLQPVAVSALARRLAETLSAKQPGLAVQWQLAPDVPWVLADDALLGEVLTQVLGNALKFSRMRSPAHIALTWQAVASSQPGQSGDIDIFVRDNGIGFAPAQADKLFTVFGKLHPAREYEGLGLGLVSCRKGMQRQGGSIRIDSAPDAGCCVTLRLPRAAAT